MKALRTLGGLPSINEINFFMTKTSLQSFDFLDDLSLRVVVRDGDPWFVAADVCAALGITNVPQAVSRLDDDERRMFHIGRQGAVHIVNESGLYALILRSNKPEARRFRKWVTGTVLPHTRKHGAYTQGAELLSPAEQAALYEVVRGQVSEALRRHDWVTEHDHWASQKKRATRSLEASHRVAREMGLPVGLVAAAATSGVDEALQSLGKEQPQ